MTQLSPSFDPKSVNAFFAQHGLIEASVKGLQPQPDTLLAKELDERRIVLTSQPAPPVRVLNLRGQRICTPGNLTVLSSQAKSGKSGVLGAILASIAYAQTQATDENPPEVDLLGFEAAPTESKAVILFDTEQAPYDAWQLVRRSVERANLCDLPGNFRCYRLSDVSTAERLEMLEFEMARSAQECGGVYMLLIDGVADLCRDPNDALEAFALVDGLVRLAVTYKCPIVLILHENPAGATGGRNNKTRGHLGSQLERKAESNLKIIKGADGVSVLFAEVCRASNIPRERGVSFAWNDQASMHATVERDPNAADNAKRAKHQAAVDIVFAGTTAELRYGELVGRIIELAGKKEPTAKTWIRNWRDLGLVVENPASGLLSKSGVSSIKEVSK